MSKSRNFDPPSIEVLDELLILGPGGRLIWRARPSVRKTWNTRHAGKQAMCHMEKTGYLSGTLLGRKFATHRVVFAIANRRWPTDEIDHIDGDRANNEPSNLREVSRTENQRNQKSNSRNKSGHVGVSKIARNGRWLAQIGRRHIGQFACYDDAVAARKAAEANLGYHPLHGSKV